ncbi:uncharacterized protein LOC122276864 [Carya illinoinensis]|uniref:uncharacterized protein LOC122276864 n=1 Tax=Carya illinoinensis TaxID=32201 RepID=UPI001C71F1C1|nr:uncharacterized protein LOC122276864 [Carya illinoinensis]
MIAGRFAGGGISTSNRKAYARKARYEEVFMADRAHKQPKLSNERMVISFEEADREGIIYPHDDALVITHIIANYTTRQVLVENRSSVAILFWEAFVKMGIDVSKLRLSPMPLKGFSGDTIQPVRTDTQPFEGGNIHLPSQDEVPNRWQLGRGERRVGPGSRMLCVGIKESQEGSLHGGRTGWGLVGPATTCSSNLRERYKSQGWPGIATCRSQQPLDLVALYTGRPGTTTRIKTQVPPTEREALIQLLVEHTDVFAWSHEEMTGIDNKINGIDPTHKVVRQKRRTFSAEKYAAINEEVERLLAAGFIREAHYPEWLSNIVIVKKANEKWRICVDFIDLNKNCSKDSFPLPRIDAIVDATSGHHMLSFMDAYSGYNQIRMNTVDEEKTSFITDRGLYCYQVMPFGLKNVGATYQRLVNRMFREQIGKSMESGKFLGFIVSERGIETSPDKIEAMINMKPLKNLNETQRLVGRVAALGRFIARSTDKCLPFFQVLRKVHPWNEQCDEAFKRLKQYMANLPFLK